MRFWGNLFSDKTKRWWVKVVVLFGMHHKLMGWWYLTHTQKHHVPSMANFISKCSELCFNLGRKSDKLIRKQNRQRVDITLKYTWQGWPNGRRFGERNLPPLHSLAHYFTTGATSGVLSRHARAAWAAWLFEIFACCSPIDMGTGSFRGCDGLYDSRRHVR